MLQIASTGLGIAQNAFSEQLAAVCGVPGVAVVDPDPEQKCAVRRHWAGQGVVLIGTGNTEGEAAVRRDIDDSIKA